MSKITAKIITDSISLEGIRLTTFQLCYPRFIHAELMTHRVFSRNASSSRAIPVMKMLKQVWSDPAIPVHWGANQSGMQARNELSPVRKWIAKGLWRLAGKLMCVVAYAMVKLNLHKQVANRLLEPWQHIHVILTSTEWDNFYALRDHKDAQPDFQVLARKMKNEQDGSTPLKLTFGGWHLPYITEADRSAVRYNLSMPPAHANVYERVKEEGPLFASLRKASGARCARVSYLTHEGKEPNMKDDLELFGQLVVRPYVDKRLNRIEADAPIHASPVEHQATPDRKLPKGEWEHPELHGNLRGWIQYRKLVELGHV